MADSTKPQGKSTGVKILILIGAFVVSIFITMLAVLIIWAPFPLFESISGICLGFQCPATNEILAVITGLLQLLLLVLPPFMPFILTFLFYRKYLRTSK